MEFKDTLTVAAILLAPLVAVQVQKWIEVFREKQSRKLRIFHTLMSTRRARVSAYHVEALNMIDTEFYYAGIFKFTRKRRRQKAVVTAWKTYLDHLNSLGESPNEAQLEAWIMRGDELFTDLLFDMSHAVGYDFDKVHLKRSIYSPKAHGDEESDQRIIRENLVAILSGNKPIPISLIVSPDNLAKQAEFQALFQEFLNGTRTVKVKIES